MNLSEKEGGISDKKSTILRVKITPRGKPRMTQRDRWHKRPRVTQYWEFKAELQKATERLRFCFHDSGTSIDFEIPMPPSWSKKKRQEMLGRPHQQKPDIDNLLKGVMDALLEDDSTVYHIGHLTKRWGNEGSITFRRSLEYREVAA